MSKRERVLEAFADPIQILDHGFVRLVDIMGDDASICDAASLSYGKSEEPRSPKRVRRLIRYLMRHRHTSPFEQCEIKIHVRLPIFVARQWVRHRTAHLNETSARYRELPLDAYRPELGRIQEQSKTNKQGSGERFETKIAEHVQDEIGISSGNSLITYRDLLEKGVARELARVVMPVATYTEWVWKCDLHNVLHFLSLRCDPHAQKEIRVYADAIAEIVEAWVPFTWKAFEDYRLNAITFSRREVEVLRTLFDPINASTSIPGITAEAGFESVAERMEFGDKLRSLLDCD